jgi:hypothetical protein
MNKTIQNTQTSYDAVAPEYAERYEYEMDDKLFNRNCLDPLASVVRVLGPLCDRGCVPVQIVGYLGHAAAEPLPVNNPLSASIIPR